MGSLEFRVLGPVEVLRDGHPINVGGPQQRRLMAALLAAGGETLTLDRLEDTMWPAGDAPDGAARTLHTYVSRLRAALGEGVLVSRQPGYAIEAGAGSLDATDFETSMARARTAAPTVKLTLIDQALGYWRGPAFGDHGGEWWARPLAARLDELRLVAQEERIDTLIELGEAERAASEAEGLAASFPLREGPTIRRARALAASGRQADAMRTLHDFRQRLIDQTGLDPSPAIADAEQAIVVGAPTQGSARGYTLGEVIGEGSFGTVYRATQPGVGREVAVKVIRVEHANNPAFIQRFEAEAQLVARLEHPHIVPLHDFWREPNGAYLVFRLMRGGSAEQSLLADGPWSLERTNRLIDHIGSALNAAHALGVIHRDIKPANVLFDANGNAHLADFGIASTDDTPSHGSLYSAGSPLYAAPEQFQRRATSQQSDLYSFAAMVWELLTAAPPFDGDSASTIARTKLERPVPPLRKARPDLPASLDNVLQKATAPNPTDRYASVAEFVVAWQAAADERRSTTETVDGMSTASPRQRAAQTLNSLIAAGVNPYKGLRSFGEADARDFFGRSALTAELADAVASSRVTVVVGASGAGKSSLLHAGLVPRLRATSRIVSMVPTDHPCAQLRTALLAVALHDLAPKLDDAIGFVIDEGSNELVLLVDQFEEVWTLADPAERERFLSILTGLIADEGRRVRCVFGIRADFFDRPLAEPDFGAMIARHVFSIAPMTAAELSEAVRAPANAVGVSFEPGLDAEIVADVAAQSGNLPLLQFALAELYQQREGAVIPASAYRAMGGVAGAVASRADALYKQLDDELQHDARRLFTRLVTPGAGAEYTRRRVNRWALSDRVNAVADEFVTHRLLVVDRDQATREPTLDIAHEALLTRWPRLRVWLDEDREQLQQLQHLGQAADSWANAGRQASDLYRGPRLALLAELDTDDAAALSPLESEFLGASRAAADDEERRERQRVRRLRRALSVAAIGLVIALAAGAVALVQRGRASDQRDRAQAASVDANEAKLAAEGASANADTERLIAQSRADATAAPSRSLLLAVEAHNREGSLRTAGAVQSALAAVPKGTLGYLEGTGPFGAVRYGKSVIVGVDRGAVGVWNAETYRRLRTIPLDSQAVSLSSDDRYVAGITHDGVKVYDVSTSQLVATLANSISITTLEFDPSDPEVIAAGALDGSLALLRWRDGRVLTRLPSHVSRISRVSFSADGASLSSSSQSGAVRVDDTRTGLSKTNGLSLPPGPPGPPFIVFTALSPDGRRVAGFRLSPVLLTVWNVADASVVYTHSSTSSFDIAIGAQFTNADRLFLFGNTFFDEINVATKSRTPTRLDISSIVHIGAAVSPEGTSMAVATQSEITVRALDVRQAGPSISLALPPAMVDPVNAAVRPRLNAAGTTLLIGANRSYLYDLTKNPPAVREVGFDGPGVQRVARFSERGDFIETLHQDLATLSSSYRQWDATTLQPRTPAVRLPGLVAIETLASSPDGTLVAASNLLEQQTANKVRVFDTRTGEMRHEFAELDDYANPNPFSRPLVLYVRFSPDGKLLLATTSISPAAGAVWDLASGQARVLADRNETNILFTSDMRQLVVRGQNWRYYLYDWPSLQPAGEMSGRATASVVSSPHPSKPLLLSDNGCGQVDFDPSQKGGTALWDLERNVEVGVGLALWCSSWSPDGTKFVAMDNDTIHIWPLEYDEWVRAACKVAGRSTLTTDEWQKYGPRNTERTPTCAT